jgi:outer membrane protein assembly factor BamA
LGSNLGNLPTYEAFCLGGSNSVRGYYDCDLGVGKSFGEATIEYRFPLFSIISGELFVDGGTAFGTQANVTGNPGGLLLKPGQGWWSAAEARSGLLRRYRRDRDHPGRPPAPGGGQSGLHR